MTTKPPEPIHFLLVDDLEENLLSLEALLRRDGLSLLRARSGPEALELLLEHEVALSLIDVQMPEMNGFELAELMRGTERTRRVPIIFLTAGNADQKRRFRGYEAGAVDFLGKPIEPDILRSKAQVFFELARHREELKQALCENARLLEESRRYARALQEADRLKDEFLAMLAHELRNPLSAVSGAIEVWKRSPLRENQEWARQVIENQTKTFGRLIDDLLDVSRIMHGKIQVRRQVIDPTPVFERAVASIGPLVQERRHRLELDYGHSGAHLDVDPTRLEQVAVNLLTNAAKYSDDGGRIRLSTRVADGQLRFEVEDHGIGIPPEQVANLFGLFVQGDRSLARSEGGLGIGLTLVKRLVEMHGGRVAAESEGLGLGSKFTVWLPAVAPPTTEATAAPERPGADRAQGPRKILVVDDNVDTARGMARLLELSGYEVAIAFDGPSAVGLARSARPKVVLLDIGLPGMDGYQVARLIGRDSDGPPPTLIALTGYGQDRDRQLARDAGFARHLTKPVDFDQLMGALGEAFPRA
ncbi:MAG: response regulator [Isosphaeraceae bacterium]